jgi:hypothetical protein
MSARKCVTPIFNIWFGALKWSIDPCKKLPGVMLLGEANREAPATCAGANRSHARRRALIVGGQKRVTLGNKRERRYQRALSAEIQGIDNEHENEHD